MQLLFAEHQSEKLSPGMAKCWSLHACHSGVLLRGARRQSTCGSAAGVWERLQHGWAHADALMRSMQSMLPGRLQEYLAHAHAPCTPVSPCRRGTTGLGNHVDARHALGVSEAMPKSAMFSSRSHGCTMRERRP